MVGKQAPVLLLGRDSLEDAVSFCGPLPEGSSTFGERCRHPGSHGCGQRWGDLGDLWLDPTDGVSAPSFDGYCFGGPLGGTTVHTGQLPSPILDLTTSHW